MQVKKNSNRDAVRNWNYNNREASVKEIIVESIGFLVVMTTILAPLFI